MDVAKTFRFVELVAYITLKLPLVLVVRLVVEAQGLLGREALAQEQKYV